MFEFNIDETTVEDKMRRLVSFFTSTPYEEITPEFNIQTGIDKVERSYFLMMMADALSVHFEVLTDSSDIESANTVQDLIDRVNNGGN
ncbi:unnamed protein product [Caenorhabditis angaria]|uniref:Uncharacterized protein n=1 Tax=Caenorhabditis angaria TaxID=860376 RepID=A0A9P1IZN0_9PELO|nr:unnamed protein product [Caenorhabditis angaria]